MSTTTDEPTEVREMDVQLVSRPDDSITYLARRSDLRLTMKARYPVRNTITGQPEGVTRGIFCGFRDGVLRLPREGMVNLVDTLDGGEHEMDATVVHQWLQKHRRYDDRSEGFWMLEQVAPAVTADEINRLVRAATEWDVDTLEEVLRQEEAGWKREDILKVAQGSIERIRAMEERVQADAQAQASDEVLAAQEAAKQAEARAEALERELENARRAAEGEPDAPAPTGKGKAK